MQRFGVLQGDPIMPGEKYALDVLHCGFVHSHLL